MMMNWRVARTAVLLAGVLFGGAAFLVSGQSRVRAEGGRRLPVPTLDEPAGQRTSEVAVLAGGCFWGVQGVFQHVAGVVNAVSGYAGGTFNASYEMVETGTTGHAESVQVTFDPRVITFGRILQVFFSVVHDPTELNRQGPDTGTQYRSAIFPANDGQERVARAYIAQLTTAQLYNRPIVTGIQAGARFFPAEAYHQNFLANHPSYPYIAINDLPKLDDLKRLMPELYTERPVLVPTASGTGQ
jgi:peptide-methionine (S)-S-oxide reductase